MLKGLKPFNFAKLVARQDSLERFLPFDLIRRAFSTHAAVAAAKALQRARAALLMVERKEKGKKIWG